MSKRYQAAFLSASYNGLKVPDAPTIGGGLTYAKTTASGNTIYTFTAGTGTVTV